MCAAAALLALVCIGAFADDKIDASDPTRIYTYAGGAITKTVLWSATLQKNVDWDLRSFRRGVNTGLKNDWNVFVNATSYF